MRLAVKTLVEKQFLLFSLTLLPYFLDIIG